MKNLIPAAILMLFSSSFLSCNKSSSPNTLPAIQDTIPRSLTVYQPANHSKIVEMFAYNSQTQLTSIKAYSYDSSAGTPVTDSILVSFTFISGAQPPVAYSEIFYLQGASPAGANEQHALIYDGQNRVIIDSITATSSGYSSQHYQYDSYGNSTIQWLFGDPQTPGSYTVNQIDTMYIQNETILTDINYSSQGGTINRLYTRSYSTHLNPLYNASLAGSLGCLMVFNEFMDFRSKYLPTQFTDEENGSPSVTTNYLWTTDATGSVVSGVGTDAADGSVQQVYRFTY